MPEFQATRQQMSRRAVATAEPNNNQTVLPPRFRNNGTESKLVPCRRGRHRHWPDGLLTGLAEFYVDGKKEFEAISG